MSSSELSQRLKTEIEKFKKRPDFSIIQSKAKLKSNELEEKVDKLIALMQNFPDLEIDKIMKSIENDYSADKMVLESIILGILEYFKQAFADYYLLIEIQVKSDADKKVAQMLMKKFSEGMRLNAQILTQITGKSGFQTYNPDEPLEKKIEILNENTNKLTNILLLDLENGYPIVKKLIQFDPEIKSTVDEFNKIIRKVDNERKFAIDEIQERSKEIDEILIGMIEEILYNISDFRKRIFKKDLKKALMPE
jgi:hypothetical protein